MKKFIVVSLFLVLMIAPVNIAFAQTGGQILVSPPFQDEITATTEDELILAIGWAACTRGLVQAWINASTYEWYLENALIPITGDQDNYWGPIEPRGQSPDCLIGTGNMWGASWRYSVGSLPAGTYVISLTDRTNHKIIDGGDYDGDGKLDFFEGGSSEVTVNVVEP